MSMLDERIGPGTARYAVLGEFLGHTWSPYIHNSLFSAAGRDAIYLPVTIPRGQLGSAVDVLKSCFGGFNITIPYKQQIIPFLDEIDSTARACGAVNTVICCSGRLSGHNTDGIGMIRALEEGGVETTGVKALILGGGGAARAAGVAFLERGGSVTFAVRDISKGWELAGQLADTQQDGQDRLGVCSLDGIAGAHDVLVNCTPVGMYPKEDGCPVSEDVIARCGAVFDAVYNPRKTWLLKKAQQLGRPSVEGLGMLYYQAVEAQKLWFGDVGVDREMQREIYDALLARL